MPGLLHDLLFKTNTNFLRGKCYQFSFIDEQVQVLKDEVTCPHSWDVAP